MKKPLGILLAMASLFSITVHATPTQFTLGADRFAATPLGVNLGTQSYWGAEQFFNNVLPNPGFEPYLDASLLQVNTVSARTLAFKGNWLGRDASYWNRAKLYAMTGAAQGHAFQVQTHEAKADSFELRLQSINSKNNTLASGDTVAVQIDQFSLPDQLAARPAKWWVEGRAGLVPCTDETCRQFPDSAGSGRSFVRLFPTNTGSSVSTYLDRIAAQEGQLLPVTSRWVFSVVARKKGAATLKVTVDRSTSAEQRQYLQTNIAVNGQWQRYTFDLAMPAGQTTWNSTLNIKLEAQGAGLVDVDNVYLGDSSGLEAFVQGSADVSNFRAEFLASLHQLKPGWLRDWQGQLADSPANRFAPRSQRGSVTYRRGESELKDFYSVPELLALCQKTGARPWLVMPTVWNDQQVRQWAELLAAAMSKYQFKHWVIEFGNENWNLTFQPAAYTASDSHRDASSRAKRVFEEAYRQASQGKFNMPIWLNNFQFVNPPSKTETLVAFGADGLSVSAYKVHRLNAGESATQRFLDNQEQTFWGRWANLSKMARMPLYVPELNLHPLAGDMSAIEKALWINSRTSGLAVGKHLIQGMAAGARGIALYSLTGQSVADQSGGLLPLFGLYPNLAGGAKPRPAGEAMAMMNRAFPKNSCATFTQPLVCGGKQQPCEHLNAIALVDGLGNVQSQWLANTAIAPVKVSLPSMCNSGGALIAVERYSAGRETIQKETVNCARLESLLLPARSLTTLYKQETLLGRKDPDPACT